MPRCPTRRATLTASLLAGFVLVACGGKVQDGTLSDSTDDAAARTADGAADAAPLVSPRSDDAAASSVALDGASVPLLPVGDASLGGPSLDGGIDPNGPCPTTVTGLRCSVEGAHLCGGVCSMQCSCAGGLWVCHLPPC